MINDGEIDSKKSLLKRIWQFRNEILLEPLIVCAILPLGMLSVTNMNFNIEKACRVNLGYDDVICQNVLNKHVNGIDCSGFTFDQKSNISELSSVESYDFNYTVCRAESESQKAVTQINAIREPIASIFPIFVILFAGGWSDRSGLRKPCMVFPLTGEIISLSAHIISAIWMNTIPMEICAIIEKVIPSMLGGQTLLTIGFLSYITEMTTDENRAFRFGLLTVIVNVTILIGVSLSGVMLNLLGYLNIYILASSIFLTGMMYLLFFIPETKQKEVPTVVFSYLTTDDMPLETTKSYYNLYEKEPTKNICIDFFDPTSAYDCFKVFVKRREFNGRLLLILFVILSLLISAPMDKDYIYMFTMKNLMWNGDMYSIYLTFNMVINLIGTLIMTALLIKILKMSTALAGLFASLLSVISNIVMVYTTSTTMFYVAQIINLFSFCKEIMINAIISSCIPKEEIGRIYSVQGIVKALCGLLLPLLYAAVYSQTMESAPGSIFLLSEVFIVPTTILYGVVYWLLRRQNAQIKKSSSVESESRTDDDASIEITRF